ncbi:hypothetical protein A2U01_0085668, partial [Trifolium medium]|nr:hypothetical protein [Trifolium medium]
HTNHDNTGSGAATLQAAVTEICRLQAQMASIERDKALKRERANRAT